MPDDPAAFEPKPETALTEVEKLDAEIAAGQQTLRILFKKRKDLIARIAAEAPPIG